MCGPALLLQTVIISGAEVEGKSQLTRKEKKTDTMKNVSRKRIEYLNSKNMHLHFGEEPL